MKFFSFEKKPKIEKKNYANFGGEFVDDNNWQFGPECILESKENLPKFLYRGVKKKDSIDSFEKAQDSLKKVNNSKDSLVNWQTESMSTTPDKEIAFSYALEGKTVDKLDLYNNSGSRIFEFLNQNMGRWLLDHSPEKFVNIPEKGEIDINWEKVRADALKILKEQTESMKIFLNKTRENFQKAKNYENNKIIDFYKKQIEKIENQISEESIKKYTRLIEEINSENIQFTIDDKPANVVLGYLFELEPKDKVRVATQESVLNFMKHFNFNDSFIEPGVLGEKSQKGKLTSFMKKAGYGGIEKNNWEKEIGFFNPEDLNPILGLEIKIINGRLKIEKHFLKKQDA